MGKLVWKHPDETNKVKYRGLQSFWCGSDSLAYRNLGLTLRQEATGELYAEDWQLTYIFKELLLLPCEDKGWTQNYWEAITTAQAKDNGGLKQW